MALVILPNGTLHTLSASLDGNTDSTLHGIEDTTALFDPLGLLSIAGSKILKIQMTEGVSHYFANNTGTAVYTTFPLGQVYQWGGGPIYTLRADRTNIKVDGYWLYRMSWVL